MPLFGHSEQQCLPNQGSINKELSYTTQVDIRYRKYHAVWKKSVHGAFRFSTILCYIYKARQNI